MAALPGEGFGLMWAIPFAGLLASIAVLPLVMPLLWHRHFPKVAAYWILLLLIALIRARGVEFAAVAAWQAILVEYLPFIALLVALFTIGGGIVLEGGPWGTPRGNTLLLGIGTLLAGVLGTTGVSMVLIHPLLRANRHRRTRRHLVLFFILLCANAGGISSPLGDPPLYVGFLRGVPFFWPVIHLGLLLLMVAVPLLAVFYLVDRHLAQSTPPPASSKLRLQGWGNLLMLGLVIAVVIAQGVWHPGAAIILGVRIDVERLLGTGALFGITLASFFGTSAANRAHNLFAWGPMREVAIVFASIFVTVIPVQAMLQAGAHGPLAPLLRLATGADGLPSPFAYFWLAGALAAVLDNAPTYLVFFQLAGDDPTRLTGAWAEVLRAISAGAVFFGGLTYIGNAPNMLVRSIAAHRGVAMPGFFAYSAAAAALLGPLLVLVSLVWF